MVIIVEVDCFRRLDAGIALPDDDLFALGMIPAQIHASRMAQLAEARSASGFNTSFPNNHLPSIQPFEDYGCDSEADMYVRRLSTITERTEKTEYTEIPARSSPSVVYSERRSRNTRAPSSASDSSYGQVIGKLHLNTSIGSVCVYVALFVFSETQFDRVKLPIDPNTIRPSPPPSALQPSEAYDSGGDGESTRTVTPPPRRPSAPIPFETPPDVADNHASTSTRASSSKLHPVIPVQVFKTPHRKGLFSPVDKPLPELPPPSEPRHSIAESHVSSGHPRKSKLSALANSRVASSKASTVSQSSRMSSSTLATLSVRTYPVLRPSSESELSFVEEESELSGTSSIVRQAIRTAMDQEVADRTALSPQKQDKEVQHDSPAASSSSSKSTAKPVSEVKDGSPTMFYTAAESSAASSGERPTSKLAKLAAKSKQGGPGLPKLNVARSSSPSPSTLLRSSHTEYLTPIANGPTATTAITTSYQTLGNLLSPAQSALPPSFPPAGENLSSLSPSSPEPKPSKLVAKARKPHRKRDSSTEEDSLPVPVHTMFKPEGNRSRASPSTFASILLDGIPLTSDEDKGHRKERRDTLPRDRRRHGRTTTSPDDSSASLKATSPKHKSSPVKAANIPLAPLGPFAFDVPSPDDVVFNARRGTSLSRPASGASTLSAFPASTAHTRSSFTSGSRVSTSAK